MTPEQVKRAGELLQSRQSLQEQMAKLAGSLPRLRRNDGALRRTTLILTSDGLRRSTMSDELTVTVDPEDILELLRGYAKVNEQALRSLGVRLDGHNDDVDDAL